MKKLFTLMFAVSMTSLVYADGHKESERKSSDQMKNAKEKMMNNPNYLMSFKECKELKSDIGGLLSMAASKSKEIKLDPKNVKKWGEAISISDLAANHSTVYNVWCKDMINHKMKKEKNHKSNRKGKDKSKAKGKN